MELSSQCRKEGCTAPRSRFSVFCDEHHREHLERYPAWRPAGFEFRNHTRFPKDFASQILRFMEDCERRGCPKDLILHHLYNVVMRWASPSTALTPMGRAIIAHLPKERVIDLADFIERQVTPCLGPPSISWPEPRPEPDLIAARVRVDLIVLLRTMQR